MREKEKKELQIITLNTNNRLGQTDVELATLRELPRRGNFIHNANILYDPSMGPPISEEISLLPHIRRDQFKLTKFLGSGAFGEVYEGTAQGLPTTSTDTRVAIKVRLTFFILCFIIKYNTHCNQNKNFPFRH